MDGQMDGYIDGMDGYVYIQLNGWMDRDGWIDEWID